MTRQGRPGGVLHELVVLVRFRLALGGQDPTLAALLAVTVTLALGVALPLSVAAWAPRTYAPQLVAVSATLWFAFLLLALAASVSSGGGRELLPRQEAVAYPVSAAADQAGALLLTPLNLAWSVQATVVVTTTAYTAGPRWAAVGALLAAWLWVAAATALAQLLGWTSELLRTYHRGVPLLWATTLLVAGGAAAVVAVVGLGPTLAALPTLALYLVAVGGWSQGYALTQGLLAALAVVSVLAAVPVVEALQRRPDRRGSDEETRPMRRGPAAATPLLLAVVTDVRSVLRSTPLRRSLGLVLVTPLALALFLPLPWVGVLVLPALVASGTALLYGVNAVGLDGRGALWRESLPHRPDVTFTARLLTLATLCGATSAALLLLAAARAGPPTPADATAAVSAVLLATTQVVSRCAVWSVRMPHPTELRHGRDAPAPPTTMARYAVVLTVATTLASVVIASAAATGRPALVVSLAVLLLVPGLLRLRRAYVAHRDPVVRARLVATVAGG